MICKNCGTDFSTNFCPKCGMKAEEIEKSMIMKSPKKKKKSNGPVIAIIAVICVLAIAVGGFCVYKLFFDKGGEDKKESSSASETKKDDKKAKSGKYDFDVSKIKDEKLKTLIEEGIVKKHIDYMTSDEINTMVSAILNSDYEQTTVEEYAKYFRDMAKKRAEFYNEKYDEEEFINDIQSSFDSYGTDYIAREGNYVIFISARFYEELKSGDYAFYAEVFDTTSDKWYNVDVSNRDDDDDIFYVTEYGLDKEFEYEYTVEALETDSTVVFGYYEVYFDLTGDTDVFYDDNGDLLGVKVGSERREERDENGDWDEVEIGETHYYDNELKSVSFDEYAEPIDALLDRVNGAF